MTSPPLDVHSLTDALSRDGDITLTNDERRAIHAALAELARTVIVRARHESLLASYGEDAAELDGLAVRGLALATDHTGARAPEQSAAADALAQARAKLATEARRAGDLRGIVAAAVRFAISLVNPA